MRFNKLPASRDQLFETWFGNHYLHLIVGLLFLFTSLSVLAPVFMMLGWILPARIIYWIYGFFCHQLPFRSWFLFGFQPFYPLADAGLLKYVSFEEFFHPVSMDFELLSGLVGNPSAGYKIALCQRDFAMYFSLLAFGIIFGIRKRKIEKIPLWIWLVFGVIPIGLDGITQSLGSMNLILINDFTRESTPFLRTVTGFLFGTLTGWYIFPALEAMIIGNMKEKTKV
jgi:uncharacterized membrane protein